MSQIQTFIETNPAKEITKDNVDSIIFPENDGTSAKILELAS